MTIDIQIAYPTARELETMIVPVSPAARDAQLQKVAQLTGISRAFLQRDFLAKKGERWRFYSQSATSPASRWVLVGLGEFSSPVTLRQVLGKALAAEQKQLNSPAGLDLLNWAETHPQAAAVFPAYLQAAIEGCLEGGYTPGRYKTPTSQQSPDTSPTLSCFVPEGELPDSQTAVRRAAIISEAHKKVLDWVNAPSNRKTPEMLGEEARASAQSHGYRARVLSKAEIQKTGLGGLLAVNQGSVLPPVFIILEYQPKSQGRTSPPRVGLVGKGVTFDTGGISLKSADNMHYLKSDMAGGAAVMATLEAVARLQLPVHLMGIVPATDNKPDGAAVNPGDIITTYSGHSVEVIDTDAEGRLILADGLAYLKKNFQPEVMIDLATLTGAVTIALGHAGAGLFSNDNALAAALAAAGEHTGERLWRLPLWEEYFQPLESSLADLKNYAGKPAGAITAAKFLEKFIDGHPSWDHLDIANTAFTDSQDGSGKSSTGFGVRLLVEYLSRLAQKREMKSE